MNTYIGKFTPVFKELRIEAFRVKYYIQGRFKDITSIIKTHPIHICVSINVIARCIYSMTIPVFLSFSTILLALDYLDHTYFYKKSSSNWSSALLLLFTELKMLQTYQSLSNKNRDELEKDPELLNLLENQNQEMLKEQAYKNDPRPVLLILKAKSDYNGALDLGTINSAITINADNNQGIPELKKKYKIVLIDNIANTNQIKDELKKITNTIQQVWVLAHGSPTSMLLDGSNKIESKDVDDLSYLLQQKLSLNAHVMLYSCSTGKKVLFGQNIATSFSKALPGRTIWAPQSPTGGATLDLGEDFSVKVGFWKAKSRLGIIKEKLWNICCLRPFEKIEVELNVTTQVKDGLQLFGTR